MIHSLEGQVVLLAIPELAAVDATSVRAPIDTSVQLAPPLSDL
jgi:hypothetical protein